LTALVDVQTIRRSQKTDFSSANTDGNHRGTSQCRLHARISIPVTNRREWLEPPGLMARQLPLPETLRMPAKLNAARVASFEVTGLLR